MMRLEVGTPTVKSYTELLETPLFSGMELFSERFLQINSHALREYARKWVMDPLHHWSRQWEYPFVFMGIQRYVDGCDEERDIVVLDAGSGVTFFPYFIASSFDNVRVQCCDLDPSLSTVFSKINLCSTRTVDYTRADIHQLRNYDDHSFDVVYCISVLEHSRGWKAIVEEFRRVLNRDGVLIVTFDISLDGSANIPISQARLLLQTLESVFSPIDDVRSHVELDLTDPVDLLTTDFVRKTNPTLLPWRQSFLDTVCSLLRFRVPTPDFKHLTCYCRVFANDMP